MRKEVLARNLRWTVTDTHISPDERFLVYSSITPEVMLVSLVALSQLRVLATRGEEGAPLLSFHHTML
jgi:hypothetical protein